MALPFTSGQRLLAADLNTATQQGAWTSYTPVWSSSGTAPALVNGTMVGYYAKVGRLVTAKIELNSGSSTTFGTGFYSWTLPVTAAVNGIPTNQIAHVGSMGISTSGSAVFYTATAFISQGIPTAVLGLINGSGNFMGATNPATFSGAGVQFAITITYESTS
jgi:hypothetical protein